MKKALSAAMMVMAVLLVGSVAHAVPVTFELVGVSNPLNTAEVVFSYDQSLFRISIDITNTSSYVGDPRVTGFSFNAPTQVTGVADFTGPAGWVYNYDPNDINTPMNIGMFDVAGVTGSNLNGGAPNNGIPEGQTYSFTFDLSGTGLGGLTEGSFLNLFSAQSNRNTTPEYFLVRFQRTINPDSDVAVPGTPGTPVPEPGTILLLGSGLLGIGLLRRKRNS